PEDGLLKGLEVHRCTVWQPDADITSTLSNERNGDAGRGADRFDRLLVRFNPAVLDDVCHISVIHGLNAPFQALDADKEKAPARSRRGLEWAHDPRGGSFFVCLASVTVRCTGDHEG